MWNFQLENNITSEISIEIDLQVILKQAEDISSSQNIRNRFHVAINDLGSRVEFSEKSSCKDFVDKKGLKNRETNNYFIRTN